MTLSIAVADVPDYAITTTDLLGHVEFALTQCKQQGGDRVAMAAIGGRGSSPAGSRTLTELRQQFGQDTIDIIKIPIVDLRTNAVAARELRALRRRTADVSGRAVYAAALNDGRLVELDLAQTRRCIELAAVLKSQVPLHLPVFCDTVLSDRFDELAMLLADAARHTTLVLTFHAERVPADSGALADRIAELQRMGIHIGLESGGGPFECPIPSF